MSAYTLTRRRALLSGAAVGSALSLPVAAFAAASPDDELILDCQKHARNKDAFNADAEDSGPNNPLWVEYERTENAISNAKPMTMAGLVAKAQAAKAEAMEVDGEENPEGTVGAIWAWDLVNDLVRLGAAGVVA